MKALTQEWEIREGALARGKAPAASLEHGCPDVEAARR